MLYISKTMMSSRRRNKALPESLLGKKANPAPAYGQTETEAPQLFHEAYTRRNRLWLWEGSGPYENKCIHVILQKSKKKFAGFAGGPSKS